MAVPSERSDHLLVVTTNFAENHGGVQAHLGELLPRLVDRGIATTVIYLGERAQRHTDRGVDVIALRRRVDVKDVLGLPDPREWRALVREIRGRALPGGVVTRVATHTRFFPMSALGVRLGGQLGVPVVHTEHGAGSVVTGSAVLESGSKLVDATVGRWVLRRADRVIAVSAATAGFVHDLAGVGAVQIPNGIAVDEWLPDGQVVVGGVRPLVFVGRVVAEKGWRDFLDVAIGVARATGVTRPVHVIGDGADTECAKAYAAGLGLAVEWHGALGASAIRDLLVGSVFVNPSVAAEGFQLTQLEALVAGAAVTTYDVGVASDLRDSGVGEVEVVASGDVAALTAAAAAACSRIPLPPTREQVSRWDWETVADGYAAVLSSARSR